MRTSWGDHHHRQVQGFGPCKHVGEVHGFILVAVNDQGVCRYGFGLIAARAFHKASSRAYEHQTLGRGASLSQFFGNAGDDKRAERKSGQVKRQRGAGRGQHAGSWFSRAQATTASRSVVSFTP